MDILTFDNSVSSDVSDVSEKGDKVENEFFSVRNSIDFKNGTTPNKKYSSSRIMNINTNLKNNFMKSEKI